ncbi:hypothetical protein M0P65_07410 [Candidatus Gracilibacteria bacterium]|nr:hypothetical protein [Candidatus Gracilibacteria bacterium]
MVNYIKHLEHPKLPYPQGYIDNHKTEIDMLKWLIGCYEGRTASKPIEYLEALLDKSENYQDYVNEMNNHNITPMSDVDRLKMKLKEISVLYNWVYYKKIIGF